MQCTYMASITRILELFTILHSNKISNPKYYPVLSYHKALVICFEVEMFSVILQSCWLWECWQKALFQQHTPFFLGSVQEMKGTQHQHDAKTPQPVYIKCRNWARPQRTGKWVSGKLRSREKGSMYEKYELLYLCASVYKNWIERKFHNANSLQHAY